LRHAAQSGGTEAREALLLQDIQRNNVDALRRIDQDIGEALSPHAAVLILSGVDLLGLPDFVLPEHIALLKVGARR
jgi:hypothetical protein